MKTTDRHPLPTLLGVLALFLCVCSFAPASAEAANDPALHAEPHGAHAAHPAHTLMVFVGPATELASGSSGEAAPDDHHGDDHGSHSSDNVGSFGLSYSYRLAAAVGVGLLWERAGFETLHEAFVMAPVSWYVTDQARLLAAPGLKYTGDHRETMLRVGGGYTFHLGHAFGIGPEVSLDWIEGGRMALVYGLGFETLF